MQPVVTPSEMAAADRRAIEEGTSFETLVDRAGTAVAWHVRLVVGGVYGRRAVVVCGKGNNGADGLVAAERLRSWGMGVDVLRLEDDPPKDAFAEVCDRADVVVDAMYGTGFRGSLDGFAEEVASATTRASATVVAVDIPSGVDGTTGECAGEVVRADHTLTFAARKTGLLLQPGRAHAGSVTVADIGIRIDPSPVGVTGGVDVLRWLPARDPDTHKWAVGGVLVVGGATGMTGAPQMVSHAAMRAGAGIVWCGMPGHDAAAAASGSEVITIALPAADDGTLNADAADLVLRDAGRFGALVVGPGLGGGAGVEEAVRRVVTEARVPLVLDADGLNALRGDLAPLRERGTSLGASTLLTPHDGEYTRLMGDPPGTDRIAAARRLADAAHSTVLLKGSTTIVAEPGSGGRVALNTTGGPWLATAGSGDVLSGIAGAFTARGCEMFEAGAAGAWVHGRAADAAGHTGLIAGDLIDALPEVLRDPLGRVRDQEA
jgi:NAD(P)H-hydrate epimerase